MVADVHLQYVDEVWLKVVTDPGVMMELAEHFTYMAPNYKFHPKFKAKVWSGEISLVNRLTGRVHAGLAKRIKKFCDKEGYSITFDQELFYENVTRDDVLGMVKHLDLPDWVELRDYQIDAVTQCIQSRRRTLVSPTSSGKSMMIYLLHCWFQKKTLIMVPSNGLVDQFESDIRSYGFTGKIETSKGKNLKLKNIDADIVISTWQSVNNGKSKMPKDWYEQFGVIVGDEAHGNAATCTKNILESCTSVRYRFGATGTLGDDDLTKLTIEGLFGPVCKTTTTRELIDQGYATNIKIKALVLHYPEAIKKAYWKKVKELRDSGLSGAAFYAAEIDFINSYEPRLKFIRKLAKSLKGNKLLFFKKIEAGKAIYEAIKDDAPSFYIDGGVVDREAIRQAMETENNANLVASTGTTATGVSIRNLIHMIATAPQKGSIKLLQAIGRMLRQHESKDEAFMYDIVDDLRMGKTKKNYVFQHFEIRAAIYDAQQFDYSIYDVNL